VRRGGRHEAKGEDGGVGAGYQGFRYRLRRSKTIPTQDGEERSGEGTSTDHRPPNITKVYSPSFYPQTMTGGSRNPWSYHKVRKKEDVTVERIGRPPHGNKGERRTATAPVMGPTSSDPQSANALIAATDDYAYSYSILPEEGDRDVNANGRHSVHLDGVKN
jgi:hypothetical protein